MALEMKGSCEKCGRPMGHGDEAFICSYASAAIVRRRWVSFAPTAAANCCAAPGETLKQTDADEDRQRHDSHGGQAAEQRPIIEA